MRLMLIITNLMIQLYYKIFMEIGSQEKNKIHQYSLFIPLFVGIFLDHIRIIGGWGWGWFGIYTLMGQ